MRKLAGAEQGKDAEKLGRDQDCKQSGQTAAEEKEELNNGGVELQEKSVNRT